MILSRNIGKNHLMISMFILLILMAGLTGCGGETQKNEAIKIAGSTTVLPIATRAAEKFVKIHENIKIMVNPGGSGVGIKSIGNGMVDIGMASRKVTKEEKKNFSGVNFTEYVVARDGVACVISSEVYDAGVKSLSRKEIRGIYEGKITNWKELGGPDRDILVIDKEKHRGTRHVFMAYIFGNEYANAPAADIVSGSNNEEQTKLAQSDTAIGMLSQAWINEDVRGVGITIGNRAIAPTIRNIRNGTYPISRDLSFITNGKATGAAARFIDFVFSKKGHKIIEKSGFVPVR